ncbi:DNA polymerase I [uncultured Gammaproteobacteria bacterium]
MTDPRTLYLIDGSGFIFRAFYGLPPMTRADGTPVNAVLGFVNMLIKLMADRRAESLAVVFDVSRTTFRNQIYPAYKANRDETPPELVPQFPLVREATRAFNLPALEVEGFEADDLIASYVRAARAAGRAVTIVSSDKDLMQLVGDGVTMLDPLKERMIGPAEVMEKFGVGPDKVVDVQSLAGDSTDNVPGVPGIGIKTAAQLINEYGDLDRLLARAGEIKQPKRRQALIDFAEQALISRRLVRLEDQVPLPLPLAELVWRAPDTETLTAFLLAQGFRSVLGRLKGLGATASTAARPAPTLPAPVEISAEPPPVQTAPVQTSYELVQSLESLQEWIERATEVGTIAIDTETDSLTPATATLVGISLATAPGRACYIPLAHILAELGPVPVQIKTEAVLTALKPLLEDPAVLKVGHNLKFDYQMFVRHGIQITPWDDTLLLSYVLDSGSHGHGMDELAKLHLNYDTITYDQVTGTGKARVTFDKVPVERAGPYAAEDADITLRLYRLLKPRLIAARLSTVYETLERPLVAVVAEMERAGVLVDRAVLARLGQEFAVKMAEFEQDIHRLAGHPFNVGSPKQLGEVLFEQMNLGTGASKKGKSGAWSTDQAVLETLAEQGAEIATRVLDWRQLAKLKNTYTDALQDQISPVTGRVHTSFALAVTNTGRLSSSDPNLQNIPIRSEEGRKIRGAFVAAPGFKLISVDYSQIELRLVAEIAGIEALRQAFRDGADIHALTASQVFGVPLDQVSGDLRRKAKAINFGIIYGISGFGLGKQLGIGTGEANTFIAGYLERFHELKAWIDQTKEFARSHGYVETLFGRRCAIAGMTDRNAARRTFAERQAINAPIQGTAADIIKRAMIKMPAALAAAGLSARMLLQVHDELLFEAPEAEAEATAAVARRVMEGVAALSVPLVAEAGIAQSWADAH